MYPKLIPRTANPELRHAVPFSSRYEQKCQYGISKSENTNQRVCQRKPGKSSYPLPPKNNFERTPRVTHGADRAQTSTTVSGWPSSVDLLNVCWNGARTKMYDRKHTKNSTNIRINTSLPFEECGGPHEVTQAGMHRKKRQIVLL